MADEVNKGAAGGGADGGGSSSISVPKFFKDNLSNEVHEEVTKLAGKDPEFAKSIPQTLPDVGKAWLSERARVAEISLKMKELEEGRKPPNSPQDYGLEKSKLPEGMVYDKQLGDAFAAKAHELGMTVKEAKGLFDWYNGMAYSQSKAAKEQADKQAAEATATRARDLDAVRTALRGQWGEASEGRMKRNMASLQNPLMMPQDVAAALDKTGILRNPNFHLWWDRQVAMMSSDRRLGLRGEPGEGFEEEQDKDKKSVTGKDGKAHLKEGFFSGTAKRHPARQRAS